MDGEAAGEGGCDIPKGPLGLGSWEREAGGRQVATVERRRGRRAVRGGRGASPGCGVNQVGWKGTRRRPYEQKLQDQAVDAPPCGSPYRGADRGLSIIPATLGACWVTTGSEAVRFGRMMARDSKVYAISGGLRKGDSFRVGLGSEVQECRASKRRRQVGLEPIPRSQLTIAIREAPMTLNGCTRQGRFSRMAYNRGFRWIGASPCGTSIGRGREGSRHDSPPCATHGSGDAPWRKT